MRYGNEWLLERLRAGHNFSYLPFWGHRPLPNGKVGRSCLSQWYAAGFTHEGIHYPTAEHWMMAGKARHFKDGVILGEILQTTDPHRAKKLGRRVSNFNVESWQGVMTSIVAEGSYHKFSQNPRLRDFLLATGEKVLVEASPYDQVWGIGMDAGDHRVEDPWQWEGTNWLGWCLMDARDRIQRQLQ
jgi:ribA/ribD-fused uncharacterized protein